MKGHFRIIRDHSLIDLKKIKSNKIYDLLVCSFIDILRISAPEIPFENEFMEFYLELLIKWLMLEEHIKDSDNKQTAFFYVLHQMAKLSVLCLLFTTRLIEQVPIVINQLFYFLEKKKFNQQQYQDFLECISSTVNEYSEVPMDLIQILLSNLGKNKKDNLEKQAYNISFTVIKENKSLLGNKIREFIIPKNKNKKENKHKSEDIIILNSFLNKNTKKNLYEDNYSSYNIMNDEKNEKNLSNNKENKHKSEDIIILNSGKKQNGLIKLISKNNSDNIGKDNYTKNINLNININNNIQYEIEKNKEKEDENNELNQSFNSLLKIAEKNCLYFSETLPTDINNNKKKKNKKDKDKEDKEEKEDKKEKKMLKIAYLVI